MKWRLISIYYNFCINKNTFINEIRIYRNYNLFIQKCHLLLKFYAGSTVVIRYDHSLDRRNEVLRNSYVQLQIVLKTFSFH